MHCRSPARPDLSALASLGPGRRVGVPVSSLVSMTLNKGGIATSPFGFEQDIVAAIEALLADGTIAQIYARYGIELLPPQ